jgi:hypothetical protein
MSHKNHWFKCANCGYVGEESELPQGKEQPTDKEIHPCGKDECPKCKEQGDILCCFTSEENAEKEYRKEETKSSIPRNTKDVAYP